VFYIYIGTRLHLGGRKPERLHVTAFTCTDRELLCTPHQGTMSYPTINRTQNFTFFHPSAVLIQGRGRTRQRLLFSERQLLRGFKHYTRYLNKMVAAGSVVGRATSLRIGRTGLRIPVGDFLIPKSIQNGPGAQPASTAMDIGVLSRG
jgi:hypothetical protein